MLTARGGKDDIIIGLYAGADDCIVKLLHPPVPVAGAFGQAAPGAAPGTGTCQNPTGHSAYLHALQKNQERCRLPGAGRGVCQSHSNIRFYYGICSDCMRNMYPELSKDDADDVEPERYDEHLFMSVSLYINSS